MIIQFHKARAGKHLMVLGAFASTFLGSGASAATQGTLGATSTGTVAINASVANRARITGLVDVNFNAVDPSTNASAVQNVCVWSNTATGRYTITASGGGSPSAFTLTGGIPYAVEWAASGGQSSGTALTSGTASASLTSAATNQSCSTLSTLSASLIVRIASTDLLTMTAGTGYAGTLTLLVTPL
ncbi:hypothetical protein [Altererythrobacter sp. Root672]|uniref:hypothetical protein n=1 Tax=Altererythrobacter sp. Root672 TaxID=1736584 RepID=UPI0006FF3422|nr:hypothetical protein [Altererythrobacter sp. Root672]KRA82686.1 hypothetical protein ASD76_00895 [Altererythrobacter sp. Root672]